MAWAVDLTPEFAADLDAMDTSVREGILAYARMLETFGPELGRPYVDALKGSRHSNMKELRPTVNKVEWRVAFAFDPKRTAILLVAGKKAGNDKTFYRKLIKTADERYDRHLTA